MVLEQGQTSRGMEEKSRHRNSLFLRIGHDLCQVLLISLRASSMGVVEYEGRRTGFKVSGGPELEPCPAVILGHGGQVA